MGAAVNLPGEELPAEGRVKDPPLQPVLLAGIEVRHADRIGATYSGR